MPYFLSPTTFNFMIKEKIVQFAKILKIKSGGG
jgi:hypothetical protein